MRDFECTALVMPLLCCHLFVLPGMSFLMPPHLLRCLDAKWLFRFCRLVAAASMIQLFFIPSLQLRLCDSLRLFDSFGRFVLSLPLLSFYGRSARQPSVISPACPKTNKSKATHVFTMLSVLPPNTLVLNIISTAVVAAITMAGPPAPATHEAGKVLIAVNHTSPELSVVEIEYRAHVLHGGVAYEWGQVSFQVSREGGREEETKERKEE